jgi:hypothetical protein
LRGRAQAHARTKRTDRETHKEHNNRANKHLTRRTKSDTIDTQRDKEREDTQQ